MAVVHSSIHSSHLGEQQRDYNHFGSGIDENRLHLRLLQKKYVSHTPKVFGYQVRSASYLSRAFDIHPDLGTS